MRRLFLVLLFSIPLPLYGAELIHHELSVTLAPADTRLSVRDTITTPENAPRDLQFTLHRGLAPRSLTPGVNIVKQQSKADALFLDAYSAVVPRGVRTFVIAYEGTIYHPVAEAALPQGIADSAGIISDQGVYLSGSSGWYPDFGRGFITFELEVALPASWDCVSQGERTRHEKGPGATTVRWKSPEPQESVYLIAGRYSSYYKSAGALQVMVFLRSPDKTLADAYLDAAARDIAMYAGLIGPHPYKKFALVENFWETGFGMPSFTLLGPTVIRLPFIINSSYPHEILHNWWGNGVYPDYAKGNWSEGLTAYLSDHLFKERDGSGAEYRVATLQKYTDYVRSGKDFPLSGFRSRFSPSSEAVGYGKSLMFFHMLRLELGDDLFREGLRAFYKTYLFRYATFEDIRSSLETVSRKNLKPLFNQWIARTGAPALALGKTDVLASGKEYLLTAVLEQTQEGAAYLLRVPVAVTLEGREEAVLTTVEMNGKKADLRLRLPARPLRLDVDPEYDLFRRLGRDEIPPALSLALGAKKMLILLPAAARAELLAGYREFAQALGRSGPDEVEVKLDSEVSALPQGRAVTILGWENRFAAGLARTLSEYGVAVRNDSVVVNDEVMPVGDRSFALIARNPDAPDLALGLIATGLPSALRGLAVKLPHYGKYSYVVFQGPEPVNVAKGRWSVAGSKLTRIFPQAEGAVVSVKRGALPPRSPLAKSE